jgi:hypothetical protein
MGQLVRAVAAGRKARALFKTLSRVEVSFNPFDPSATTARFVPATMNDGEKRSFPQQLLTSPALFFCIFQGVFETSQNTASS